MMAITKFNWAAMSDNAVVSSMGEYVKQQRLKQNKTQSQVAKDAGVNRWTISKFENGESISVLILIQIIRALDLMHIFDVFKTEEELSPLQLAKLAQKKRQRARRKNSGNNNVCD